MPYLLTLDYPNYEIIVVIDDKEPSPWKEVKVVPSGPVGPAQKRDIGESFANGQYLAFIDDDAYPRKDWLKNAIKHFARKDVAAVCGPGSAPLHVGLLEKAANEVSNSKLCWGNVTFRNRAEGKVREVDDFITANLIVRRNDYKTLGGFGTAYWPGEDTSFCLNIIEKLGKKILYDPQVAVYHFRRPAGLPYLKQVASYGLHRGYFAKILPRTSLRLPYLVPSLFILGCLGGLGAIAIKIAFPNFLPNFLAILLKIYAAVLIFYALLLTYKFLEIWRASKNIFLAALVPLGIASVHLVYGLRFLQGFLLTKNLVSKYRK